jgi:hypothetical protein
VLAPSLVGGELEQRVADAAPVRRRVDGDVVDVHLTVDDPAHDGADDLAAVVIDRHRDPTLGDERRIVVLHRGRLAIHPLEIHRIGAGDDAADGRDVAVLRRPRRDHRRHTGLRGESNRVGASWPRIAANAIGPHHCAPAVASGSSCSPNHPTAAVSSGCGRSSPPVARQ